jgi:hypothetical protein
VTTEARPTAWTAARRVAAAFGLAVPLALLAAQAGCGEEKLPAGFSRKALEIKEVPDPVLKSAKKTIPGVEFKEAWSNLDKGGKIHSYEIRGRASNGKIREVRVAPTGEILEME